MTECHCGKEGHALNSVNCPVHGAHQHTLQDLYDSEINFVIECFWDAGFRVSLGDRLNGWKDVIEVDTFDEAVTALCGLTTKHFPDSAFAKKIRGTGPCKR